MYDPAQNRDNKREIAQLAKLAARGFKWAAGPLAVSIVIYKRTAKKQMGWNMARPDADNCAKLILDALNGVVYADDAQVCNLHVEKHYGERSYTRVVVTEL